MIKLKETGVLMSSRTFLRKSFTKKSFQEKREDTIKEDINWGLYGNELIRKKKINKRGQIEIGETLLVLLIIIFLIVGGIFAYYGFFARSLGSLNSQKTDTGNLILLHVFESLPETKCENDDCVDVIKLFALKELIKENRAYYGGKFKNEKITIEFTYPELQSSIKKIECTLDKFQQNSFPENCGYITIYDNLQKEGFIVSIPVSLYFANLNEFRIGLLKI